MKKQKQEVVKKIEVEKLKVIRNLDDLKEFLKENKLNPLEKTMAMELLLRGYVFLSQFKISLPEGWIVNDRKYFVADFIIPRTGIIIETDGKIHLTEENQIKDRSKDNVLTALGFKVFRFNWDEVMGKNENWDIFTFIDMLNKKGEEEANIIDAASLKGMSSEETRRACQ